MTNSAEVHQEPTSVWHLTPSITEWHTEVAMSDEEKPAAPAGDPISQLYLRCLAWALRDPRINTDHRRAYVSVVVFMTWMLLAFSVLFAAKWIKEAYRVEDPIGIVGAIIATALFVVVWIGGARLTLRWFWRLRG